MARVWRAVKPRFSEQVLSGVGAASTPGRWNLSGQPVIYTASWQALSLIERLVYLTPPLPEFLMTEIEIPDEAIRPIKLGPGEHGRHMTDRNWSQTQGSRWLTSQDSLALSVPSVHIDEGGWREEPNILINPEHPRFSEVRVARSFIHRYDQRLSR